ncbi:MAG: ATP-binding protein [Gemmatimonadota bacterium]
MPVAAWKALQQSLSLSLEWKLQLGFAAALTILVGLALATLGISRETARSAGWVAHTLEVQGGLARTAGTVSDVESGALGFVITGDTAFLTLYRSNRPLVAASAQEVRRLTVDNPAMQHRLDSLDTMIRIQLAHFEEMVNVRLSSGSVAAGHLAELDRGRTLMSRIGGTIASMETDENGLLASRLAAIHARTETVLLAASVGALLAFAAVGVAGILTRRELAERRRAEARFRTVVESAPSGMVMIDPSGTIRLVNREIERLFNYSRDELLGKPFQILVPEQLPVAGPVGDMVTASRTRPSRPVRDLLGIRKDGVGVPVEIGISPLHAADGSFILASVIDITERKKAENELRRSNEELERFAYVASHDLQEPLRTVGNYVDLLAKRYRGKLDEDGDEFIGFAHDGALRMQQLIKDLLAVSRIGGQDVPLVPTDTDAVLVKALGHLTLAIEESGGVVSHGALPTLPGDPSQLEHLFLNLVTNALKFRRTGTPEVGISAERRGAEWLFRVTDNGIGISPENFDRIFVIFQRLHSREQYAGTGIGLAVARKIVERHGGRIWVESELGVGTTFLFTLPALRDGVPISLPSTWTEPAVRPEIASRL